MIINNWYVAAPCEDIGDEPVPVRMLGCDFVMFRDAGGRIACLSDVCCHRGASLSRGRRTNGCVQCPYHGWEYGADGRVRRIPPLGEAAKIPARARVDSYPVQERYGFAWAFLGDLPEGDRPALPELLPEYGDADNWRMTRTQRDWNVNWARLKENLADSSHLYLVHTFGKHLPEKTDVWTVEETDWGIRVPQVYTATPNARSKTAVNAPQAARTRPRSEVLIELSVIGMIQKNSQLMSSGYNQVIWNALTPIDAIHTRHFNLHFRNFQMRPEDDEAMLKTIHWGLEEDARVIDHLRPLLTPASQSEELFVATDGPEKAYRDKARRLGRQLGSIDVRRMQEETLDRVLVIPSPARANGGQWVHDTVPLMGR
jgi:phenylpropionate dioxygenase-like ring-hydroxylating dioxygenase large terminal subunit